MHIAIVGSRIAHPRAFVVLEPILRNLAERGEHVHVGCCTGIDELVMQFYTPAFLHIYTIFDRSGDGRGPHSAVDSVLKLSDEGADVKWKAGGQITAGSYVTRLVTRTRAVAKAGRNGVLAVWCQPESRGTLRAAREAASFRHIVWGYNLGGTGPPPKLGIPGDWRSLETPWQPLWKWVPHAS